MRSHSLPEYNQSIGGGLAHPSVLILPSRVPRSSRFCLGGDFHGEGDLLSQVSSPTALASLGHPAGGPP